MWCLILKTNNVKLRAGIIGASGIGLVHSRIYEEIGIDVVAILSSSEKKSIDTSDILKNKLGITVSPFYNIDDFLNQNLDLISVCSSSNLHYEHVIKSFNKNIPVFCEKPLIDISNLNSSSFNKIINKLKNHPNRHIYVNTSNTVFIDSILKYDKKIKSVKNLKFEFFTNGPYNYLDIALDLFPHAFSVLTHMFKEKEITDFVYKINKNKVLCNFKYGDIKIEFDLREDVSGPKHMLFCFDEEKFVRMQSGFGKSYEVYLNHVNSNKKIPSNDPFKVYISNFIDSLKTSKNKDQFDTASLIMKLILQSISKIKNK